MHLIFVVDSTTFYIQPNKVYINFSEGKPHYKTMYCRPIGYRLHFVNRNSLIICVIEAGPPWFNVT